MSVLCVLKSKDKKDNEVQTKYKERTKENSAGGMDICPL